MRYFIIMFSCFRTKVLFYSDWGSNPKIGRLGFDGSDKKDVITTDLVWPNGVAVDQVFLVLSFFSVLFCNILFYFVIFSVLFCHVFSFVLSYFQFYFVIFSVLFSHFFSFILSFFQFYFVIFSVLIKIIGGLNSL